MFKFRGGKPGKFFISILIAEPADKVEKFAGTTAVDFGIGHFGDLILQFSLNINWQRQRLNMVRNFVRGCGFKHRDMKDGVNTTESVRKTECIGVRPSLSKDFKGA